jgi:hypothetical protein
MFLSFRHSTDPALSVLTFHCENATLVLRLRACFLNVTASREAEESPPSCRKHNVLGDSSLPLVAQSDMFG